MSSAAGKCRKVGIVHDHAESRRRERYRKQDERRPDEIEQRDGERDPAKDLMVVEHDRQPECAA